MAEGKTRKPITEWSGWDYAPGIAFVVVGILALLAPPFTSLVTGAYLGAMLCVAGGFMLAGGLASIGRRGSWLPILLGLLAFVTGLITLYNPVAGAISLVWVMGAWFIVGGIFELVAGFSVPVGKGWLILVGIINIVIGGFVVMMDPSRAFTFLGYLVGFSLIFRGMWSLLFAADLHKVNRLVEARVA